MVKNNVISEDAQCSETDFCVHEFFFCVTFSFSHVVDFVFDIHSELVWDLNFCEPDADANQDSPH